LKDFTIQIYFIIILKQIGKRKLIKGRMKATTRTNKKWAPSIPEISKM